MTLCVPIGQSELSMSITCCARTPCGVLRSIRTPAFAAGAGGGAQLVRRHAAEMTLAVASARRLGRRVLRGGVGAGNVQHYLELEQLSPG